MRFIRYLFICWLVLFAFMHVFAQEQTRGFGTVTPPAAATKAGRTVALVVGVSDYPFVTPLNYAAEDALLMYDFLQSSAGGNVSPADIRLLVNEEATSQNIWTRGISWIERTIKPTSGDRVIIYLAGHGDAVSSKEAYFLCYNANPAGDKNNYNWTDALAIDKLKNRIEVFAAGGAEVVLIMDACRSGDLPGVRTGINSPFESVIERKTGETLMLSAGANQLAIEDKRWGRGHGAFTWHLVLGLSGMADENKDGSIDFYEIEQYTKGKVRKETQAIGRTQVPQFAASSVGGGSLGRVDNVFLTKLVSESISAVSINESIALARSSAESSWFSDSAIYSSFNELKRRVRQGKFLGQGSAEVIYDQLVAAYNPEDIEPVRIYYMSALASAGFEAINKELIINIGKTLTPKFYERRFQYLIKADMLQRKSGEVYLLDNYRKLVEAIYLKNVARERDEGNIQFSQGMVDSLSAMRDLFGKTAAYYYWMDEFHIDPFGAEQARPYEFTIRNITLATIHFSDGMWSMRDSCNNLAPNWSKMMLRRLEDMSAVEPNSKMSEGVLRLIALDSLNADYWYLLSKLYDKQKPYNLVNWYNALLKSSLLNPNTRSLDELMGLSIARLNDHNTWKSHELWLKAEALQNHYHFSAPEVEFDMVKNAIQRLVAEEASDELYSEDLWHCLADFIDYSLIKGKYHASVEVFASYKSYHDFSVRSLSLLSSIFSSLSVNTSISMSIDSVLREKLKLEEHFFIDERANCIAWRIHYMADIPALSDFRMRQIELLKQLAYPSFSEEWMLFLASECIDDPQYQLNEEFYNDLLQLCHENPNQSKFEIYVNLLNSRKLQGKILNLYNDSCFQNMQFYYPDGSVKRGYHNDVAIQYFSFTQDSLRIDSIFKQCILARDTLSYYNALYDLGLHNPKKISRDILLADTTYLGFNSLLQSGQISYAQELYEYLIREDDKLSQYAGMFKDSRDFFSLFMRKGDFKRAAEIFEEIIDMWPNSATDPWKDCYFGYDTFIQSKEYKAMMARVYTSPEN